MSNKSIQKIILIDGDVQNIWKSWTTKEGIKSFFAPDCEIEIKVDGKYEMYFRKNAPKGEQGSEGCKILSFIPYKMLSFTWNAPPEFPGVRLDRTYIVLEFEELLNRKTLIRLYHLGWKEGEEWDKVYEYFDRAWTNVLQWLQDLYRN